jgi:hypothetical protein
VEGRQKVDKGRSREIGGYGEIHPRSNGGQTRVWYLEFELNIWKDGSVPAEV